jgi:thiazole synthase
MELGASAVLTNTAIASSNNPVLMSEAMKLSVEAGLLAFQAGRMDFKKDAIASSPNKGIFF